MELAAGVRDEAARHEGAANEGRDGGAGAQEVPGHAGGKAMTRHEDAELHEGVGELGLLGDLDEVVARLVQDAAAHGERGLEVEELVRQLDGGPGDGAGLGRDSDRVAARTPEGERAAHAHDSRELRVLRGLRRAVHAGELVFDLGGKRHG